MKALRGILIFQSWGSQAHCWSRNAVVGPERGHIWQPWSWRWGSSGKAEMNGPGSKISDFYPKLFARWVRLAVFRVSLLFSSIKWAKSFVGLCSEFPKSREVPQIKDAAAEQCLQGEMWQYLSDFSLISIGLLSSEASRIFHLQHFHPRCERD